MTRSRVRLEYLDALRGIAAYVVVAGHFFPDGWVKSLPIINLVTDTKIAVAIFFILSGVVLASPKSSKSLSLFWLPVQIMARLVRLAVPVLAVSLLVWFLVYFEYLFSGDLPVGFEFWHAYVGLVNGEIDLGRVIYFSLVETFFLYDPVTTLITPAWTMRPEFVGSIVVLLYTWLLNKGIVTTTPLILIAISIGLIFTYRLLPAFFYFGFFLTGVAFRQLADKNVSLLRSPTVTLVSVLCVKTIFETFGIDSFELDFIFASAIILALMEAKPIHGYMCWTPFLWLAKISFPLYLLHVPIIASVGLYSLSYLGQNNIPVEISQFLAFGFLSIILFLISWIFVPIDAMAIKVSRQLRKLS
jgi:peptidoglycan/LPS O-acetylase OafA/YrhL